MDRDAWNLRYAADEELVWTAEPNRFLVSETADLAPGRALDVACGEGRNAVWLAERGFTATGVDFAGAGLAKATRLAQARGVDVTWIEADLRWWDPPTDAFDLIVVLYLQLPAAQRRAVHQRLLPGLAPGGTFLVVGHDLTNLSDGHGGPQDPAVLFTPDDVAADLAALDLVRAERVQRTVHTPSGPATAIDALVRAVRPRGSAGKPER